MGTKLLHVGFGNALAVNRLLAVLSPGSAPTKRLIQEGKGKGLLLDMTNGRRTKAVLVLDSGHVVLAAVTPETIAGRLTSLRGGAAPSYGGEK